MSKFDTLVDTSEATSTTSCDNYMLDAEECSRADTTSVSTMKGQVDQVSRDIAAANVKHIYREDVVRRNDNKMIGVVTEVAGDSDSESDITDDDDEDDDDEDDDDNVDESGGDEDDADDNESENGSVAEEDEDDGEKQGKGEEENKEESEGVVIGNKEPNKLKNSDDKDDEDREKNDTRRDSLPVDQVRVLWLDDSESKHHFNELTVVDRGFLHGDYVASASDPTGQVGLVVDVSISVDLLAPDGSIVRDVPSRDLQRVRDVTVGDYVVLGPWLGRVDDVLDNITVLFDDGSMCKVMKSDPLRLRPLAKNLLEDGHCPYHPGQRVKASSSSVFKNAIWLSGSWKANRLEGTVTKVTVGSVYVHWIASAGYGSESTSTPAEEQSAKNLKLLSCFTHANWQLGDWCLLPSLSSVPTGKGSSKSQLQEIPSEKNAECDSDEVLPDEPIGNIESMDLDQVGSVDENAHVKAAPTRPSNNSVSASKDSGHDSSWPLHRKKLRKVVIKREKKPRKKEETFEKALLIVNTKTEVDVAWQDGITQRKLNSTSLIPVESPGDHDFMPEEYVVEKSTDDGDDTSEMRRIGVVKNVNAKEKTACVRWLKQVARPEDMRAFEKEEIVSVYELEGHQDYDYCYGDVVVRLLPASNLEETTCHDSVEEQSQTSGSNSDKCDMKKRSADSKTDATPAEEALTEFSDLSWVGNITGLRNGDIEVTWADGMVSTVGPQAIYVVGRDDDDASIIAGSEISDAASWETVEDDEMDALDNEEKEPPSASGTDGNPNMEGVSDLEHTSGMNGPLAIPLAAIGFVTRLASGIFSRGRKDDDSISSDISISGDASVIDRKESSSEIADADINDNVCAKHETSEETGESCSTKLMNAEESLDREGPKEMQDKSGDDVCSFKRFDTAQDPLDHFFLDVNVPKNNSRKWLKKVQQDWNILQNNLPDGIYVRVYEDRMDLLRAVIVGAYGTPYQDGLFFFDFHLPPEYPDVPPSAHYHSGGWRLNPNLYEEGKVCLSLLNTWTGRGNEVWDPKSSSILQVLVSLQGLVLNSKPYFNEAGYDRQVGTAEGEKNSLSYNENTFLLSCKTMMYLMRKPPKDFDSLIKDHFKRRGYYILKACDIYMKGYLIGTLSEDASITDRSSADATSLGFKLMLAKIVPKLFAALSEVGANCSDFKHLQQQL